MTLTTFMHIRSLSLCSLVVSVLVCITTPFDLRFKHLCCYFLHFFKYMGCLEFLGAGESNVLNGSTGGGQLQSVYTVATFVDQIIAIQIPSHGKDYQRFHAYYPTVNWCIAAGRRDRDLSWASRQVDCKRTDVFKQRLPITVPYQLPLRLSIDSP